MNEHQRETAILIGWTGRIYALARDILTGMGIDSVLVGQEALADYPSCLKQAAKLFESRQVLYVAYSALIDKDAFPERLTDLTEPQWKAMKQTSYHNLFNVSRTYARKLLEQENGHFLVIGSVAGLIPAYGEEINGAASASAFMVMKSMAAEMQREGATVSAIALGSLEEDAQAVTLSDTETLRRHIPAGKPISAEAAARGIVRQLTEGSGQINGNVTAFDSGFSCSFMRDW
jgi:NAD(P)-dependent dehydrogenase (short-subunit alcohol dehydrogenase family)